VTNAWTLHQTDRYCWANASPESQPRAGSSVHGFARTALLGTFRIYIHFNQVELTHAQRILLPFPRVIKTITQDAIKLLLILSYSSSTHVRLLQPHSLELIRLLQYTLSKFCSVSILQWIYLEANNFSIDELLRDRVTQLILHNINMIHDFPTIKLIDINIISTWFVTCLSLKWSMHTKRLR